MLGRPFGLGRPFSVATKSILDSELRDFHLQIASQFAMIAPLRSHRTVGCWQRSRLGGCLAHWPLKPKMREAKFIPAFWTEMAGFVNAQWERRNFFTLCAGSPAGTLMCHKATRKNLIGSSPLFRIYVSINSYTYAMKGLPIFLKRLNFNMLQRIDKLPILLAC